MGMVSRGFELFPHMAAPGNVEAGARHGRASRARASSSATSSGRA